MIEILAGVVAIAKAIPALQNIFDQLVILWVQSKNNSVDKTSNSNKQVRRKIIEAYKKAVTNEDKKRIFKDFIINSSK